LHAGSRSHIGAKNNLRVNTLFTSFRNASTEPYAWQDSTFITTSKLASGNGILSALPY